MPSNEVYSHTPVTLPPGRFRLSTRPSLTGSLLHVNTMGIVDVADLAANGGGSQRELFEHAISMGQLRHTAELKGQIARFLHKHKGDDREPG